MAKCSAVLGRLIAVVLAAARPSSAVAAPAIEYSPTRFDAEALAGSSVHAPLTLRNTGDSTLELILGVRDGRFVAGGTRGPLSAFNAARTPDGAPGEGLPPPAPRRTEPWAAGPGPWIASAGAPLPAPLAASSAFRVLILHCDGNVTALRAQLEAFPEFQGVDVWEMSRGVPRLADLTAYAGVLVAVNTGRFDPDSAGDVLADYVDQGGGLVLTLASFVTGYEVRGRLMLERYMPYLLASGPASSSQLGAHDERHPIMSGVFDVRAQLTASPPVAPDAEVIAHWADGRPFVATLGRVAAINLFTAIPGHWTGDAPALLRNALLWSAGKSPWLRLPTTRVTLAPGEERSLDLAFVGTELDAGSYESDLVIASNDPARAEVTIPARFVVRGAPRLKLSGGEQRIESHQIFSEQGQETAHRLLVGSPPPDTIRLDLVVDGDYGDGGEYASVTVEGRFLGTAGPNGKDCEPAFTSFTLLPTLVRNLLADGAIEARVRNTPLVDAVCRTNLHTVRLRYERPADPMELDSVFVGAQGHATLLVRNTGSDVLHVHAIRSSDPAFVPERETLTLAPGQAESVGLRFTPGSLGDVLATLTVESDDPLTPSVELHLRGFGLPPPDVDVHPGAIAADLPVGGQALQTVEIQNLGDSPLTFHLRARSTVRARVRARQFELPPEPQPSPESALRSGEPDGAPVGGDPSPESDRPPRSSERAARSLPMVARTAMPGARVLIVQDVAPWGTLANETALSVEGVPFEVASMAQLDTTDLSRFALVIIASDQTDFFYSALGERAERLEDFVGGGGVLEVHAAGWGNQGGDASRMLLPGGVTVVRSTSDLNQVVLPGHPLAEGVPLSIPGTSASHAWFSSLPPSADVVARDERGFPVLAVYALGRGIVVASGQTVEFAYTYGQAAGPILVNMLRYSLDATPKWLRFEPSSGVVPPGGSLPVTLTFDAADLDGGAYAAELLVLSDDPDEPVREMQANLRVSGAPHLEVSGRVVVAESRTRYVIAGALTTHRLAIDRPPGSSVAIVVDVAGDFGGSDELALVTVEGFTLGTVGPISRDCSIGQRTFVMFGTVADQVLSDGVIEIFLQNSSFVDAFCAVNEHRVRVFYVEPAFPMRFKDTFVGACDRRAIVVRNAGTEPLEVRSITTDTGVLRVNPATATLAPRREQVVLLDFCPDVPGPVTGHLTIASNDPSLPTVGLTAVGRGLPPPQLSLTTSALELDLLAGESASRTVTLRNGGASRLDLRVLARAGAAAVPGPPGPAVVVEPEPPGDSGPGGALRALPASALPPLASNAAARVLIVEDLPPWGRLMNEAVLDELGIPYDRTDAPGLASKDLTPYAVVLIAGDQVTGFYSRVGGQGAKLAAFLEQGGTLQVHAAGWGSNLGDASYLALPGGVGVRQQLTNVNTVVHPNHPLVAGVPNPFTGTYASHAYLVGLPADALVLVTDDQGGATLAEYTFGVGRVIVATQPLEYALVRDQSAGGILRRLIPYALGGAGGWLRASLSRGSLPPGDSLVVRVDVETSLLRPGRYAGELQLTSNDPRASFLSLPVDLRIANLTGSLRLEPRSLSRDTTGRAITVRLGLPAGQDARSVLLASVQLNGVPPDTSRRRTSRDEDDDGLAPDDAFRSRERDEDDDDRPRSLRLRFDRSALLHTFGPESRQPLVLSGALASGDRFLARDTATVAPAKPDDDDDDDVLAGGGASGRSAQGLVPDVPSLRVGPNPSSGPLRLELALPRGGDTRVEVFSLDGRLVRVVTSGEREAGTHLLAWDGQDGDGRDAPAGVYLVRVRAPALEAVRRVIRMR